MYQLMAVIYHGAMRVSNLTHFVFAVILASAAVVMASKLFGARPTTSQAVAAIAAASDDVEIVNVDSRYSKCALPESKTTLDACIETARSQFELALRIYRAHATR